jgi:hypothetical protein
MILIKVTITDRARRVELLAIEKTTLQFYKWLLGDVVYDRYETAKSNAEF